MAHFFSLAGARDPSPIPSTCDCFHSDAAAATAGVSWRHRADWLVGFGRLRARVCVCVCERERERERKSCCWFYQTHTHSHSVSSHTHTHTHTHTHAQGGRVSPVTHKHTACQFCTDWERKLRKYRRRREKRKEGGRSRRRRKRRRRRRRSLTETLRDGEFVQQPPVSVRNVQPRWVPHLTPHVGCCVTPVMLV